MKNVDIKIKNVVSKLDVDDSNIRIVVIDKYNRFMNNVIHPYKSTSDKIKKFKKRKVNVFKRKIKNVDVEIIEEKLVDEIVVIDCTSRFLNNVILFSNTFNNIVCGIRKDKIPKLKFRFKDLDLNVENEKNVFDVQVNIIDKINRFKSNVIQYSNEKKNMVGSIVRTEKNKEIV